MHWKIKALIQNSISLLPTSASYEAYYWSQRRFGSLRRVNPLSRLSAGIETWKRIQRTGRSPSGKVFLEIGTGRAPLAPLAYWLMGAESSITIDLNRYLEEELIAEHLRYIYEHNEEILESFGSLLDAARFKNLMRLASKVTPSVIEFLDLCHIEYIAPGNAASTPFPEQHVDFHTSYTVLEHIPPNILVRILNEGNRIIKDNGLFVHKIDYSDHFSHSDKHISAINFLQYSDHDWDRYAGNRYMYSNRLRHDDFLALFEGVGQQVVEVESITDQRAEEILKSGSLILHERFSSKKNDVLAISGAWIISEKLK